MAAVYKTLGTCPQDNLLWDSLTGREHLLYYARLRGLQVKLQGLVLTDSCQADCRQKWAAFFSRPNISSAVVDIHAAQVWHLSPFWAQITILFCFWSLP